MIKLCDQSDFRLIIIKIKRIDILFFLSQQEVLIFNWGIQILVQIKIRTSEINSIFLNIDFC